MMESREIQGWHKDTKLFARYWSPAPSVKPRALVFICHGFSEHLGLYQNLAQELVDSELFVFGHDHQGHGLSTGKKAYIEDVDQYVLDIIKHCNEVRRFHGSAPLFLIGHSMGGMVALRAAIQHPDLFRGVVLQGPLIIPGPSLLGIDFRISRFKSLLARFFLSFLDFFNPELVLGSQHMNLITRDKNMKEMLSNDNRRWTGGCTIRLLLAFVRCLEDNFNLLSGLEVPFLTLHGDDDYLCNVEGSRYLFSHAMSEDKEIYEFVDAVHQLYLERPHIRHAAIRRTVQWIAKRCD